MGSNLLLTSKTDPIRYVSIYNYCRVQMTVPIFTITGVSNRKKNCEYPKKKVAEKSIKFGYARFVSIESGRFLCILRV